MVLYRISSFRRWLCGCHSRTRHRPATSSTRTTYMRVPVSITIASLLYTMAATATASVPILSSSHVDSIKTALLQWKASAAGQEARKRGLLDPSVAVTETTDNEIARFARGLDEVARLQEAERSAVFSMDTPFALLSYEEYTSQQYDATTPLAFYVQTESGINTAPTDTNTSTTTPAPDTNTSAPVEPPSPTIVGGRALSAQADVPQVDSVNYGCVTPVKFAGACFATYAFAAVDAIETNYCIQSPTKKLYRLSEQDALACSIDRSCKSGITPTTFAWVTSFNGGSVCTEESLPYTLHDGDMRACSRVDEPTGSCDKPDLQVVSYVLKQFPVHQELEQVVRQRAVTTMINWCNLVNQYYKSGVLRGNVAQCPAVGEWSSNTVLHKTMLIVGYGKLDGIPYWKVKNSDGIWWGMDGFGYIERGFQGEVFGAFGVEQWISYPLFKSDVVPTFDDVRVDGPRRGWELLGADLKYESLMQYTPVECATICRRESGCKGYVFSNKDRVCTLKSSVVGERYAGDGIASGKVVTKAELQNGLCLPPEDNVDYPGEDMYHTLAATSAECCDMCFAMDGCNAYSWSDFKGGMCYLKWRRAVKPVAVAPSVDGAAPSVRSGLVYKCQGLLLDTDFPGNDLLSMAAAAPMDCCAICRVFPACKGYTWSDFNSGRCWLKSDVPSGGGNYVPGVHSAIV